MTYRPLLIYVSPHWKFAMPDNNHSLPAAPRPADPCLMVIFGASGDLTRRKLLPALLNLRKRNFLSEHTAVIGVARTELTHDSFREYVHEQLQMFCPET